MSESEQSMKKGRAKSENAELFRRQRTTARKRAMQFLYGLDVRGDWTIVEDRLPDFEEMLLDLAEDTETLQGASYEKCLSYMRELVRGVGNHIGLLDALICRAAKNWRLERMGPVDRCLLRVACYEMGFIEKVTAATAINEAVELSKQFGQSDTPRFVNGVLDRVRRIFDNPEEYQAICAGAAAGKSLEDADDASQPEDVAAEDISKISLCDDENFEGMEAQLEESSKETGEIDLLVDDDDFDESSEIAVSGALLDDEDSESEKEA